MRYGILSRGRLIADPDWRSVGDVMRGSHAFDVERMPGELVTIPERIQRQRSRGWRMPVDAVYVGRPSVWGNPFPVASGAGELFPREDSIRMHRELILTRETTFTYGEDEHRFAVGIGVTRRIPTVDDIRRALAGKDLVCWCPLDLPCHADTLLALAAGTLTQEP